MLAKRLLETFMVLALAFPAWAIDEGIDYRVLDRPQPTETGEKIEVLEIFWYGCPHCFYLEPTIEAWHESKPENAELRRMPAVLGPRWEPHARAFYAAELLGVIDKLHKPLFWAMHEQKRRIFTEDDLVAFAAEQGIDAEKFREAYNSFFVHMKVRRAVEMVNRFGIDGVPAVVVNGKYVTSPSQVGSREGMIKVLNELIEMESGPVVAAQPVAEGS